MVELFLLNDAGLYLEVELGPWGHHLVLLLDNGKDLRHSLPLAYSGYLGDSTLGGEGQTAMNEAQDLTSI